MVSISLCMIVKNEEKVIARCLNSVKDLVDEIIIVDTGSTDKTKEIVGQYTANLYDFAWIDDFSAARNFSFSKAKMDYIFWLDADDVLLEENRQKFITLKNTMDPSVDVVMMKYDYRLDPDGNPTLTFSRERLLKRSKGFKWKDPIHEFLSFNGRILNSDIRVTHKHIKKDVTDRNLRIFEKMLQKGIKFESRNIFYYARELFVHQQYDQAIVHYHKFLETEDDFTSNYVLSCLDLAKCYDVKKDKKNVLKSLIRSFEFDNPRAEVCCRIGYYYKNREEYLKAIFWFKLATQLEQPMNSWGFVIEDYWGVIPNIELSICYFKIGKIEEAIYYNNQAAKFKPEHDVVKNNRSYFEWTLRNRK